MCNVRIILIVGGMAKNGVIVQKLVDVTRRLPWAAWQIPLCWEKRCSIRVNNVIGCGWWSDARGKVRRMTVAMGGELREMEFLVQLTYLSLYCYMKPGVRASAGTCQRDVFARMTS